MNAAEALHSVLTRVTQSGATTVLAGWEQVLETDASLPEFVLRHAEVVRLVELIGRRLYAAETNDLLVTTLTHLPNWYRAVAWRGSWTNTGEPAAGIIAATDLNYLQLFATNGEYNDDTLEFPTMTSKSCGLTSMVGENC